MGRLGAGGGAGYGARGTDSGEGGEKRCFGEGGARHGEKVAIQGAEEEEEILAQKRAPSAPFPSPPLPPSLSYANTSAISIVPNSPAPAPAPSLESLHIHLT